MRPAAGVLVLGLIAWLHPGAGPAHAQGVEDLRAEKRLALVIGNGSYATSPLRNPTNDARALGRALRGTGFEVLVYETLTQKEMRRAIIDFGDRLRDGGVGLFYFAGHGLQTNGRNSMVPVDADIKSEAEVEVESVDVASVLSRMETASGGPRDGAPQYPSSRRGNALVTCGRVTGVAGWR